MDSRVQGPERDQLAHWWDVVAFQQPAVHAGGLVCPRGKPSRRSAFRGWLFEFDAVGALIGDTLALFPRVFTSFSTQPPWPLLLSPP